MGDIDRRHASPPVGHVSPLVGDHGTMVNNCSDGLTRMLLVAAAAAGEFLKVLGDANSRRCNVRHRGAWMRMIPISVERTAESLVSQGLAGLCIDPNSKYRLRRIKTVAA